MKKKVVVPTKKQYNDLCTRLDDVLEITKLVKESIKILEEIKQLKIQLSK
jgi:hypothetical protein